MNKQKKLSILRVARKRIADGDEIFMCLAVDYALDKPRGTTESYDLTDVFGIKKPKDAEWFAWFGMGDKSKKRRLRCIDSAIKRLQKRKA